MNLDWIKLIYNCQNLLIKSADQKICINNIYTWTTMQQRQAAAFTDAGVPPKQAKHLQRSKLRLSQEATSQYK